ncbi:MAG: hypothetical protein ABW321_13215 [Polyangiales bacterium]
MKRPAGIIALLTLQTLMACSLGQGISPIPEEVLLACPGARRIQEEDATSTECTEIGCISGLYLTTQPSGPWPHGSYRFEIDADGELTTCTGSLPLRPCGERSLTCDSERILIAASGCALPASAHGFSDIHFSGHPKQLHVKVLRDEAVVAELQSAPMYALSQPNGKGCDPVCCQASAILTLDTSLQP